MEREETVVFIQTLLERYLSTWDTYTRQDLRDEDIAAWCRQLATFYDTQPSRQELQYLVEEQIQYATAEDIGRGTFAFGREEQVTRQLADAYLRDAPHDQQAASMLPATPQELHGVSGPQGERCRHCGSDKTLEIARQTRSADEPTNFYGECTDCGLRWKR